MKKLFLIALSLACLLCACGGPEAAEETNITTTESAATTEEVSSTEVITSTEEPFTLDPNRQMAIMEPLQGGPMLYTFTGRNGKLGLINQDGELVAQPQYEPSNTWNYSAEYSVDVKYSYDENGRVNGITVQKGEKGEEFIHYTLDGKSRKVDGFPENSERIINRNEALFSYMDESTGTILDADQKPIYTTRPGEKIIILKPVPYELRYVGLVVQDEEGNVVEAIDYNGKPTQSKPEAQFYSDGFLFGGTFYQLKDGKWIALDLRQYIKPDIEAHSAIALVITEKWVIVETGQCYFDMEIEEIFAIDWNGNRIDDCPLMPFITLGTFLHGAGEQGPNYYWVEHDGQRGYINTKGEWLFIDNSR